MGRKHIWRPAARAKAVAELAVATGSKPLPQRPPAEAAGKAAVVAFDASAFAERAAAAMPRQTARFVDGLRSGIFSMLDNVACARIAHTTHSLRAVSEALVAERLQHALHESYILRDAVAAHKKPLLALSHLESLAKSELLFEATRDLLKLFYEIDADKAEHSGVLLEVDGNDEAKLCDAISMIAFPSCEQKSTLAALLESALSQFKLPKERWWIGLLKSLGRRCHSTERESGLGSSLKMFMHGVGDVLPVTNVALRASKSLESPATAASLLCQCLERLMYPATAEALVLHIALPVDAGALVLASPESDAIITPIEKTDAPDTVTKVECSKSAACWAAAAATGAAIAQAEQPQEFLHTLRKLEESVSQDSRRPLELWAWRTVDRYFVLFLE